MTRNNIKKWIIFLIISAPFIDFINGFMVFILKYDGISVGQVIRMIFLPINLVILFKIDVKKFVFIGLLSIFIIFQIFLNLILGNIYSLAMIIQELVFDAKFIYGISIIILMISVIKKKIIFCKDISIYAINSVYILSMLLVISTILNLNVSSYGGQAGSRGLFMEINSITATLLVGFGLQLNIYFRNLYKLKEFLKSIIILIAIFMLGTKAALLFSLILLTYFILRELASKKIFNIMASISVLVFSLNLIKYYIFYGSGIQIMNRMIYFYNNMDIISFLLSGRNQTLINIYEYWSSNIKNIVVGTGYIDGSNKIKYLINGRGSLEMDFFDVYYFWGIIIGSLILIFIIKNSLKAFKNLVLSKNKELKCYGLNLLVIIICTALGGHVIFSPLASMFLGISIGLNNYKKSEDLNYEKNILDI